MAIGATNKDEPITNIPKDFLIVIPSSVFL
jgi:hypothetical protein